MRHAAAIAIAAVCCLGLAAGTASAANGPSKGTDIRFCVANGTDLPGRFTMQVANQQGPDTSLVAQPFTGRRMTCDTVEKPGTAILSIELQYLGNWIRACEIRSPVNSRNLTLTASGSGPAFACKTDHSQR